MPILNLSANGLRPLTRALFETPAAAGRKITVGFSYVQRITKPACYEVWFPPELKRELALKMAAAGLDDRDFPAQWAAVRQFELLHEAGNYKIYDLDPGYLTRALRDVSKSMRAGGYRVTVATLGTYDAPQARDELALLDHRLEKRISHLIHMLYLEEASDEAKARVATALAENQWDFRSALPHIGMVLGAEGLFRRAEEREDEKEKGKGTKGKKGGGGSRGAWCAAKKFFEILDSLPRQHIHHDTAVGLQLPESNAENEWPYVAASDETLASFNLALSHVFDKFNGISLSRLQGREDAGSEVKATVMHLHGYGHPLGANDLKFYREASLSLG